MSAIERQYANGELISSIRTFITSPLTFSFPDMNSLCAWVFPLTSLPKSSSESESVTTSRRQHTLTSIARSEDLEHPQGRSHGAVYNLLMPLYSVRITDHQLSTALLWLPLPSP